MAHSLSQFLVPFTFNLPLRAIHSLLHVFGGEVQVSVIDPLDLEPVLEVVVSTAAKLHLQAIDGLLLETAARHVCVLVETDAVSQTHLAESERYWTLCLVPMPSSAILVVLIQWLQRWFINVLAVAELVLRKVCVFFPWILQTAHRLSAYINVLLQIKCQRPQAL